MVTGAGVATVNRLPVLVLPMDLRVKLAIAPADWNSPDVPGVYPIPASARRNDSRWLQCHRVVTHNTEEPTSLNPGINGLRRSVYIISNVSEVLDYGIPLDVAKFLYVIAIRNRKEIWISLKSCIELS